MRNAIILHGMPSKSEYYDASQPSPSNAHWLPWLQKQLLMLGVLAQTPEMPIPYAPNYQEWSKLIDIYNITPETLLIGHSCGAGFWLQYLGESKHVARQLILVAPWLDPNHDQAPGFFGSILNGPQISQTPTSILVSDDDDQEVLNSVNLITTMLPQATINRFTNLGHFTSDKLINNTLPQLLKLIDL